jgi:hypothetical protein
VYTKLESSKEEVEEDNCKKDPNFTFARLINFSFMPLVTRSSPRSPLQLIPLGGTLLNIPASYITSTKAPPTPIVGPSTPIIKRRLSIEFSLLPPRGVN